MLRPQRKDYLSKMLLLFRGCFESVLEVFLDYFYLAELQHFRFRVSRLVETILALVFDIVACRDASKDIVGATEG